MISTTTKTLALVVVAALSACKGKAALINKLSQGSADTPVALTGEEDGSAAYPTEADAAKRVAAAFPGGPATEHSPPKVKFAPVPPPPVLDPSQAWILEIPLTKPMTVEEIEAAFAAFPSTNTSITVALRKGASPWLNLGDDDAPGTFDRAAVSVALIDTGTQLTKEDTMLVLAWLGGALPALHAQTPLLSMRADAAVARADKVHSDLAKLADRESINLTISRADGKPFSLKLAWDALYSAGFIWDGSGFMHWAPSDDINSMFAASGTDGGDWIPEDATKPDATTAAITLSFDVARNPQPDNMLAALLQDARYIAKRVGGRIIDSDDETPGPMNETAVHKRVMALQVEMKNAGVTPGSDLAAAGID